MRTELNTILKRIRDKVSGAIWHQYKPNPQYYYVVSYPKSGNTWVRFLLANVLSNKDSPMTFQQLGEFIPDRHRAKDREYIGDSDSVFNSLPVQIVKSHDLCAPGYHRVIYVVRDGRDVMTSYYYWLNARSDRSIELSDIICGKVGGLGLWSDHVLSWMAGSCRNKLLIRYEDLLNDTENELKRMLSFLHLSTTPEDIDQSAKWSSFDEVQKLEKVHGVFDGHTEATKKVPFARKGESGDWETLFTTSNIVLFWNYHEAAMRRMGYV